MPHPFLASGAPYILPSRQLNSGHPPNFSIFQSVATCTKWILVRKSGSALVSNGRNIIQGIWHLDDRIPEGTQGVMKWPKGQGRHCHLWRYQHEKDDNVTRALDSWFCLPSWVLRWHKGTKERGQIPWCLLSYYPLIYCLYLHWVFLKDSSFQGCLCKATCWG